MIQKFERESKRFFRGDKGWGASFESLFAQASGVQNIANVAIEH